MLRSRRVAVRQWSHVPVVTYSHTSTPYSLPTTEQNNTLSPGSDKRSNAVIRHHSPGQLLHSRLRWCSSTSAGHCSEVCTTKHKHILHSTVPQTANQLSATVRVRIWFAEGWIGMLFSGALYARALVSGLQWCDLSIPVLCPVSTVNAVHGYCIYQHCVGV